MPRQINFTADLDQASQRKKAAEFKANTRETFPVEVERHLIRR